MEDRSKAVAVAVFVIIVLAGVADLIVHFLRYRH
jgi:hypothetical protein